MKTHFPLSHFIRPFFAVIALFSFIQSRAVADDVPAGTAKGTFTPEDKPAITLTNALAFVDVKDSDKPVILILSDRKLDSEKWTSEFDIMEAHPKFNGVAFWFDKDGNVFRSGYYLDGQHTSLSGYFEVKLNGAFGKDLSGKVITSDPKGTGPKVDAAFHVILK